MDKDKLSEILKMSNEKKQGFTFIDTEISMDNLDTLIYEKLVNSNQIYTDLLTLAANPQERIKKLSISYLGLYLQMPEMFTTCDDLMELDWPTTLLTDLVERFKADNLQAVIQGICNIFIQKFQSFNVLSLMNKVLDKFALLSSEKEVCVHLVDNLNQLVFPLLEIFPRIEMFDDSQRQSLNFVITSNLELLSNSLYSFLMNLIKNGFKNEVLDFFSNCRQMNEKRSKIHFEADQVSSDGFVFNLESVLLKFSEPIVDKNKLDLIDPRFYLARTPKVSLDSTKLKANAQEFEGFERFDLKFNFVTEIFFLTVEFFRISSMKLISRYLEAVQQYKQNQEYLKTLNLNPFQKKKLEQDIDLLKKEIIYIDTFLDQKQIEKIHSILVLLERCLISKSDSREFSFLPEYLVSVTSEFYLFALRRTKLSVDDLVAFIAFFLTSDKIKNPYVRSQFVQVLYVLPDYNLESFNQVDSILHGLTKFYIEIESTGAHSQFYDKFNSRFYCAEIFKHLWPLKVEIFKKISENPFFINFLNLLMNDTTFLLDESLTKLAQIRDLEQHGLPKDPNTAREQQNTLLTLERQCTSYMQLANANVNLLKIFTEQIKKPFLKDEIVDRLASMLNYNLVILLGPKCSTLKVKDPAKFHFYPKLLLKDITQVLTNLSISKRFLKAIANDSRSYDPEIYKRAGEILGTDLNFISERVEKCKVTEAENPLLEIPDEFLDPILFTLMKDPVILTTSGVTLDRSTVVSHLLNDQKDPFNRQPLTLDQVKPNVELYDKIQAFLASMKK